MSCENAQVITCGLLWSSWPKLVWPDELPPRRDERLGREHTLDDHDLGPSGLIDPLESPCHSVSFALPLMLMRPPA